MVSSSTQEEDNLVYGVKQSSVGPASVTGSDVVYEPSGMDLAMKLHYLKGVYYFRGKSELPQLPIAKIKEPMFYWLNHYFVVNGRFRRTDSGRPYIKCNDCGVRFIEAKCSKTTDEWFEKLKEDDGSLHKLLVPNQIIGPELFFSPPVLVQFTWFKCGGFSFGLSWAHVLGDLFAAADFLKMWEVLFSGLKPASIPDFSKSQYFSPRSKSPEPVTEDPLSLKRVDPVGDNWICPTSRKMATYSFHMSPTKLSKNKTPRFETICALFWKKLAQVRDGLWPRPTTNVVTVVRKGSAKKNTLTNSQVITTVETKVNVAEADVDDLAKMLLAGKADEKSQIAKLMEFDDGLTDCIIYGGNLTFVNWENCDLYGLELRGEKPVLVNYTIDGVGENGVVLVLPSPKGGDEGQIATVILPEDEAMDLKCGMNNEWLVE